MSSRSSPTLLLLDEPSSGVAQRETEALGELLARVKQHLGATLIVIEHDMPLIMGMADRIVAMDSGAVIAAGHAGRGAGRPARPRVIPRRQRGGRRTLGPAGEAEAGGEEGSSKGAGMSLSVHRLRCEHLVDPLGIDTTEPRLSWQVHATRNGTEQVAYQVLAASSPDRLAAGVGDLWDSGRVRVGRVLLVPWNGPALGSRQRVHWTVQVWDDVGDCSGYAPAAWWEMGLLDACGLERRRGSPRRSRTPSRQCIYFRSSLVVDGPVREARAYATALGVYELTVNGHRVTTRSFLPGWTDYHQRIQYQVLDLTDALEPGENEIGAALADGWYSGYVGFVGEREHYGDTPQLLVQIEVETDGGRTILHEQSEVAGGRRADPRQRHAQRRGAGPQPHGRQLSVGAGHCGYRRQRG